ncbi:MAG TPA: hypothetical protein VIY51_20470 [Xanthobacteraceae bacterium]
MTEAAQVKNVGDCEIHSISFTKDTVHLRLFDPFDFNYFTIVLHGLRYMLFETNHFQNVLSSIAIFDSWADLKKDPAAAQWLEKLSPSIPEADIIGAKIAYFQPTAGGETLIIFEHLEYDA